MKFQLIVLLLIFIAVNTQNVTAFVSRYSQGCSGTPIETSIIKTGICYKKLDSYYQYTCGGGFVVQVICNTTSGATDCQTGTCLTTQFPVGACVQGFPTSIWTCGTSGSVPNLGFQGSQLEARGDNCSSSTLFELIIRTSNCIISGTNSKKSVCINNFMTETTYGNSGCVGAGQITSNNTFKGCGNNGLILTQCGDSTKLYFNLLTIILIAFYLLI